MVSNEEIKRMLEAKRKGINIKDYKNKSENYKVCSQCETKNPENAIFCVNCGNKLDKNLNIKCPSCGTENNTNAKFCVGCGKNLNQKTIVSEPIKVIPKDQTADNSGYDVEFSKSKNESKNNNKKLENKDESITNPLTPDITEQDPLIKNDSKKVCPACNGKNLKTAKFCVVCGKNFDKKDITSPSKEIEENKKLQSITPEIKVPNGILNVNKKYTNDKESNKKRELSTENNYIDPVEKIKKSKELLDMGAITSEEFEHIKKKYLEQI